jgi:hypothetical protein
MNKGELKTMVLDYAGRSDLSAQADGFVLLAEGLIKREMVADVYTATLDETDRVAGGVYTLPAGVVEVRVVRITDGSAQRALEQKSLAELRTLPSASAMSWFAVNGPTIELRGVPETDAEIELHYFGHPVALDADGDENDLLDEHPALYVYGSLFHLYQYTQDVELAQAALDTFSDALRKLNEAAGRKLGGASVRGPYYFGPVTRGY